jgi:tetratricopeptide (TPR) repeat protein
MKKPKDTLKKENLTTDNTESTDIIALTIKNSPWRPCGQWLISYFFRINQRFPALFLAFALLGIGLSSQATSANLYEEGRDLMYREDWYGAVEAFKEMLRLYPSHAEATAALAECYYNLGEYDEALSWVRKARTLARGNLALTNLEAVTLIAQGRLENADSLIREVLSREPYNKEALFAAAELDLARGRSGDAVKRYQDAARRFPDDRRVLVSLALVLGSLGQNAQAKTYIDRALKAHPEDYRVYYYAAYLDAQAGRYATAARYAEQALFYRPGHGPARSLLGTLRYKTGRYDDAARLADEVIAADRNNAAAWYLKGMAYAKTGRPLDAISVLSIASTIDPQDEFIRFALEDTLLSSTTLEDTKRAAPAAWHFGRARDFRRRGYMDQALQEYQRGLRLNPYAPDRKEYAELLRIQRYPSRYLEELRFLQDLGQGDKGSNDAVETYSALLQDAVFRRWEVDPLELAARHWKVAVFSLAGQQALYHVDAGAVAASYIRELLVHDRNINPVSLEPKEAAFSTAFRAAREGGADYFLLVSLTEGEGALSLKGELFVARTGSPAAVFTVYRTGGDRLRNAARTVAADLAAALPLRGVILNRRGSEVLIDKGKADGVAAESSFEIVRKGRLEVKNTGTGLTSAAGDVTGTLVVSRVDDEVSLGKVATAGFYDRVQIGDEVYLKPAEDAAGAGGAAGAAGTAGTAKGTGAASAPGTASVSTTAPNPELRALLRTLR